MIGEVPDRGGRTESMQAPPPEMPGWSQRQPDQGKGGGRGGAYREGGGGYRGGGGGGDGGGYHGGRGHQGGGGGRDGGHYQRYKLNMILKQTY